jgi:ATP-dependent RNA circularization protein (DNA/RNA ligase family)
MEALIGLIDLGFIIFNFIDVLIRIDRVVEIRVSDVWNIDNYFRKYQIFNIELSRRLLRTQFKLIFSAIHSATVSEEFKIQFDNYFKKMIEYLIEIDKEFKIIETNKIKDKLRLLFRRQVGLKSKI